MTTKERLHQIIDGMDLARAEGLLVVLEPGSGAADRHLLDADGDDAGLTRAESNDLDDRPTRSIAADDPLWSIVGALSGPPDGPGDVARNHDTYLADAYADSHEP